MRFLNTFRLPKLKSTSLTTILTNFGCFTHNHSLGLHNNFWPPLCYETNKNFYYMNMVFWDLMNTKQKKKTPTLPLNPITCSICPILPILTIFTTHYKITHFMSFMTSNGLINHDYIFKWSRLTLQHQNIYNLHFPSMWPYDGHVCLGCSCTSS